MKSSRKGNDMKKKTLLIKTADLCIRIHYKYPYIEQQCETWRVNEGYEPDIEVSVTDEEIGNGIRGVSLRKREQSFV